MRKAFRRTDSDHGAAATYVDSDYFAASASLILCSTMGEINA